MTKPKSEIDHMISLFGTDAKGLYAVLEKQFSVLMTRAQVLMGLCGVVITTTGFSGRIIAGTSDLAQWLIISGISLTLAAAAVVVFGVLPLKWLTQQPGNTTDEWLAESLRYRDSKLRHYRVGVVLMLAGLTLYVAAIALMLAHPEADAVESARKRTPVSLSIETHLERHDPLG
ncbi:MAG: hypothetical protein ACI89L_001639 [Phycisphaerales bacterium]|jgi:hypothetical protein